MSGISNYVLNQKINSLLQSAGGGGGSQNIAQVLTQGNNASGLEILNLGGLEFQAGSGGGITFEDGTQQFTAPAGGGGVANPMTANLDAANFNITNIGLADTFYLDNIVNNQTTAPVYKNYGAVVNGNDYDFARISTGADAEGSVYFVIRCRDAGFKQILTLQIGGLAIKSGIRVISHITESDTLIFNSVKYGTDAGGVINYLALSCITPSATCEYAVYQNQQDWGSGLYPSGWFVPTATASIVVLPTIYTQIPLSANTTGTSGNWYVKDTASANDTQTNSLATTTIRSQAGTTITAQDDLLMDGNNIKEVNSIATDNIGVNLGSEIQSSASINLGANQLQNVSQIFVDSISESTPLNKIQVNNVVSMNTNKIEDLANATANTDAVNKQTMDSAISTAITGFITNPLTADINGANLYKGVNFIDPVLAQDVATKNYVDSTAGSSGVQNPMTSNLDGGAFQITNVSTLSNVPISGLMSSNGTFQHVASAGSFQIGGTDMTTDTDVNFKRGASDIMTITKATQTIDVKAGTTMEFSSSSIQTFAAGGHNIQYQSNTARTTYDGEISCTFQPAVRRNDFLTLTGQSFGAPVVPMCISPMTTQQFYTENVADAVPFTAGLGWNAGNNGDVIPLYSRNSLASIDPSLPRFADNNSDNATPYKGYFTGIGINNSSNAGGWLCSGIAEVELVYGGFPTWNSFSPPIIVGQAGGGGAFNTERFALPYNSWVEATDSTFGFIELGLKLNISGADTIDTQSPANKSVQGCAYILTTIPLI